MGLTGPSSKENRNIRVFLDGRLAGPRRAGHDHGIGGRIGVIRFGDDAPLIKREPWVKPGDVKEAPHGSGNRSSR
jgi:hypothetical protein